ncbi:MAG: type IX secretion system membrane protein PorP/SprF [Bacteroidia bacterium]|nr:type IX secretion system membrane protein PorP/SprF [Bacteroidia bacterium]
MKRIFTFCSLLLFISGWSQQDAQYTQYMFNHLAMNPAYAGTRDVLDVVLQHRTQWTRMDGGPLNSSMAFQMPIGKKKAGVGVELLSEKIGPKSIGSIRGSYSYRIKLGPGKLSFGLKMGVNSYHYDWNKIKYRDLNDPFAGDNGQDQWTVISADFGMFYYTKSFYSGLAITHLNQNRLYELSDTLYNETQVPHLFLPVGVGIQLSEHLVMNPSILLKATVAAPLDLDVNCNFLIDNKVWLGAGYRMGYGVSLLGLWNISDHLRMGYSYDYGLNRIGAVGRGSHEFMLGYGIGWNTTKTLTPRYL